MSGFNERLEALFAATVALGTEAERAQDPSRACPDPTLRLEVESLVASYGNPDPIFDQDARGASSSETSSSICERFVGLTLDEKYRLERLLGKGGMGAVYLSTHLGTGRYVAVKLIAPEFMRLQEFLQRFRREARAAGRLRHPNIVDVTDFGVASAAGESVAYLVMEYLDGCTLSDVLGEEKRLPLHWVVDIMEQVCSAVHEAHQQGIIHRDLKPSNIWLEPNPLGGYRVKVLDFGIAKLAEASDGVTDPSGPSPVMAFGQTAVTTETGGDSSTASSDIGKAQTHLTRLETALDGQLEPALAPGEGLTGVGALLGTPAYMSPEQGRSQALDARSDIYSLGIIAYQMLSGTLPFTGETASLLESHQARKPAPLSESCQHVPKSVSRLVMSALEKNPEGRPQTASAFAQALRANAEELATLYRRAFALYSEYFPQVMKLSLLAHIPVVIVTLIAVALAIIEPRFAKTSPISFDIALGLLKGTASFVTGSLIAGMMAIIVVGLAVAPLKPVTLGSTFAILRRRLRPLLRTSLLVTLRILFGGLLLVVPGLVLLVRYSLWAPVVLLEELADKAALHRSRDLASRSWRTCILAVGFQILVTGLVQWMIMRLFNPSPGKDESLAIKILTEMISLSGILVTPLVSIVLALVYLKMRQLGGQQASQLAAQLETGSRSLWEKRAQTRLSGRLSKTSQPSP